MNPKRWTIKELLEVTTTFLTQKGIDNPRLSAEILLAHQLNLTRVKLYIAYDQPLNEQEINGYRSLIKRRLNREPIQYITGTQEFWSLDFDVDPRVLIPRPESEILVEQVRLLHKQWLGNINRHPKILDLCTGSGALAISIAREIDNASICASDISEDALTVASSNSKKHETDKQIGFIQGDLWQPIEKLGTKFDFIISNPPYVASIDYESLSPEVRDHEPRQALDGHHNGMFYIEQIIMNGPKYLEPGGWLLIEMDPAQIEVALTMIEKKGNFSEKRCIKDYSHRDRVIIAKKD